MVLGQLRRKDVDGLTVTPPADSNVDFTLSVTAVSTEADGDVTTSSTMALPVTVRGVADTPIAVANDVRGLEDTTIPLSLSGAVADTDGSEQVSIVLSGTAGRSAHFARPLQRQRHVVYRS